MSKDENSNPNKRVIVNYSGGYGAIQLRNCSYVDLNGNNDPDLEYGILIQSSETLIAGINHLEGDDHIEISYIEIDLSNVPGTTGSGIVIGNENVDDETIIYDTFEIHHNYIHNVRYAGMYLGKNQGANYGLDDPWIKNIRVHHNLFEDMGHYGITMKGIHSTNVESAIYYNTLRPSNPVSGCSTGLVPSASGDDFRSGFGTMMANGGGIVKMYGNYVEKAYSNGIKLFTTSPSTTGYCYDNIVVGSGCGATDAEEKHGIRYGSTNTGTQYNYNNTIINSAGYGIYLNGAVKAGNVLMNRNQIGGGLGEWYEEQIGDGVEGTGENANVYHNNIEDFNMMIYSFKVL